MLDDFLRYYSEKFIQASTQNKGVEIVKVLEEMKAKLRATPPETSEVIQLLEGIRAGARDARSEFAFMVAWSNLAPEYCPILCDILGSEECQAFHEPAVELLIEIGDGGAVPALEQALRYRWSYDEWLLVPRKALQALMAIGTPDAIAIVKRAAGSSDPLIREEATSLLDFEQDTSD